MQTSPSQQHSLLPAQILRPEDRMTGSNPVSPSSSGSPASSGGMSPLHLGQLMNDSIDGIETPRFHTRSSAASAPNQWDSLPDQSPKVPKLDKNQSEILEQAKHEAKIENRIAELKKEGFWSTRRLSKVPEPARPKVHWDYLCEEMQWLAADFAQERRWKRGVARKVVRMVIRHHEDLKQKEEKAKRDEQAKLRRIAASVAKEIRQFWTNVEKVVQFKQQSRLEEKRKKTLDLQLDFIVGQTEKYSDLLTQSLNVTLVPSKTDSVNTASTASSPLHSAGAREDEDGDFQPLEEEDDEETIEVEEQQEGNDLETQRKEVEQLKRESELPLEELLQSLPQQILASSCSDDDDEEEDEDEDTDVEEEGEEDDDDDDDASKSLESESNLAGQKEDIVSNLEEDDEEFTANEEEAEDEEETIEAEEAMDGKVDHAAELNQLALEGEMPIEELLQQYSDFQKEKWESLSASSLSQQGSEEDYEDEEETSQLDSAEEEDEEEEESEAEAEAEEDENEDIGMAYLLQGAEDHGGRPVDSSRIDNTGPKKEITDIAATAESLQPKGYTLATAQVKTPVPFLLHGTLREYQHIGLDWLVTMYEKKLNGILADEMGLGKTIQTISLLAHLAIEKGNWGPHLIIVPTSVMLNWEMELKRWCPSFKILTYYGSQKERKLKRQGWTKPNAFHVCITSYKLVLQDHQAFRRKNWKYLILDEAQNIKNFKSQRWQSLLRFNSQRRLLLTGTPLQNSLMELWSLMHFLMPHVFQSHREFKEWFSNPLTGMIEGSQEYNEGLIKRLHKVLRPFLLRRVKVDVEKQMPKKYEHVIHCRLSKRQRYLYDDFMAQAATRETLASGHFMSVINILMQLRKVCNHPNLFDPRPIHSPFITEGICFTTASLALQALERDPFKHVDLDIFDLINLECRVSRYESDIFLPKRKVSRLLIEEIAESPDPPPRPKPVKMKVNRMFQPVPKPEGRPVVMVNSPRVSTLLQKNPAIMDISVPAPPVLPVTPVQPVTTVQPVDLLPPVTSISQVSPMPHVSDTHQVLPASLPLEIPLAESGPILLPPQTQVQTSTAFVPALGLNTSAATTTVTSLQGPVSTPQVLPMTQMPQKDPKSLAPPVTTASTTSGMRASPLPPPDVRMPQSGVSPGSIAGIARPPIAQTTTGLAGFSFPAPGNIQQRLLLSPDMQARLPSGEVISIAQLASLANRPTQNMPGTKPITFQLHGNRLTLSGPNLRQMSMAQPRQLQGNVVHLVSAGGQHHIISQPAHMALLQAMAQQQQQQQQQQPPPQLQQSGQVQAGVQTLALQAMPPTPQPTLLTTTIASVTAAAGTTAINAGAQAGVTVSGLVPQISTTAAPLVPMPPSSTTSILGLRNLTTISSPVNNMASQDMTLSSPAPLPLPHSLIALGSVTTTVTQPLATNPPLVQVPTCNLSSALASRPLTTATLLPSTLISAPSSTASVAPLQNTDSPSTLAPSLSLKVASDHSCLVPSLWPLASTPPILVSGQFSNPVPVLATTLPSGTTSMLTSTVASSSTFLQAPPLPSPNITPQLTSIQTSCSFPMLSVTQTSGSTSALAANQAPMLSPAMDIGPAEVLTSNCSASTFPQAVTPITSSAAVLAPVPVTSSVTNQAASSINMQTKTTLLAPLRTPLQASAQVTNALMPASNSVFITSPTSSTSNASLMTTASSFSYVHCPAPVSCLGAPVTPIFATSSISKLTSVPASGSAPLVATLVSSNLAVSSSPPLQASLSTLNSTSLVGSGPSPNLASGPVSIPPPMLASVSTSSQSLMQVPSSVLNPVMSTNQTSVLGPRTFTLVSNPVQTCVPLTVNCPAPAPAPISVFTAAPMHSTQSLATASSSPHTLVPCHLSPVPNLPPTLNPVFPSNLIPIQPSTPPSLAPSTLMQSIPIAPSLLAKSGSASSQTCSSGVANINNTLPGSTYGMQLVCSTPNPVPRPTVTSAQIFSQEALQNLISVSSNGMLLGSSTSSQPPRPEVTSALIPSQATVHNIVSVPNNAMHLAGSTSTQALTPLPLSSSPSAHVGHVTASVSAPNPLSAPAPVHLTSLSGPADHLTPSPLPSVPVNNLPSTTISSLATTLASNSLPSHIASAPKHQQSCSSLYTSTALSQTPAHISPSGLAAQSLTPTSSTFSTSIVHTTTPCSSTLATSAGRPLTPTNCSLTTFANGSQPQVSSSATTLATWPLTSVNSCLINTADRPPTPVNSSHTTSACRPLTPISCSAATLGTHPLTPLTSYVIGTASRPPTPVNNYPTTLASRPLTPVTNSQTNVVTRPMTPVTSSITTVVSRPLTLVANSLSTVAAHPLTCVSSSLSAAAWPQTPISSASTLSATQSTAPAASTVLTLTPRTQSSMAFKEELETLMLRSTTPTPPPSTSFLMPRPRRQPPPPPRSPFYLESLEDRRKRQKRERLDRLFRINERHCAQSPIYGTEIIRLCSLSTGTASFCRDGWWGVGYAHCYAAQVLCESKHLDAYWQVTKALSRAILSPQQRMEQLEYLIDRFIFVMPPVEAPAISVHSCHPPPSLMVQQTVFKETLRHELGPRSRGLHRIICNMRTQFPDLRLIQYDCGKLQTLDRLLRQLKVGSHRVLIFTQMTRMLDVLEQFLNYHGHIYLRLDGSTRVEQRQSLMDRFNADKRIFCFILSTRSGGVGVNLTGADTVIFYDSDWNPTMDAQAQDRCHRIGQTRDVHIYRLISERTVEENILKKANQKRMLGDMAIEGGNFTTAYFRQQTIRDLFEMPTEEGTKKESESTSKSSVQEEEDAAPTKQNQILEQALCKAEDEEDIRAATQAKAEQVAELAEFNENIPLDADDSLGREEEEEMSKAEQEIASLVEQLTPIERYAMNFLESSLEDISKEELKQAEEQVEAARKDLDLAKDEVFQLPIEEEESGTNEENHSKKSKKSKAFNRPERPGTRVSERLRGTRISGMEFEETAHNTSLELLQKKTQPINEPLEKKAMEQTDMDMRKLSRGAQRSPLTIPEDVSLHQQDTIKLLAGGKQDSEGGEILSSQPPGYTRDCKQKSLSFSEPKLAEEDQQEQLASRSANVDCVQNERDMVREVRLLQSAHSPSKDSQVKGEFFALSSLRSGETQLLLRLPNVSKTSQEGALEDMFCDNTPACAGKEGQFHSQNLQSLSMEVSLSKEVGEGTSATQETLPLLPRIEESVPFIKEVEQSEIAEPVEIASETGHPSRKMTQSTDLTDLLKTLNDTSTVALEVASEKEIGSSKILCNHMLENSEVNQVVEDPKVNLITSREISYPSKTVERQRHRRASQSHKPEALPRVALERLVSPSERTRSESCQVKDGFAGTTDEGKQPPESTEQKPDTQHSERLKDLTEPTLCATSKVVELTSDRDLNTSVSSVAKSDDFPEKNHSQNTQFLSIEADDTPTTKSTRLNDEILITTDHTESVVLHQKFTSKLEAFNSENTAKLDHSMTTVHKEGLLGADVHAVSDDKETENISISIKKGKSETSLERKQLVCDEVVLCKGSTSHLALDDSALSKESFDRLPMCEVQLYKEKLCPLLLDEVVSSEGSIPSAKTCDMKVRVGHQYVEEVSENTRPPPCRSSLETSAPSEEGVEATTDQLKPSPPRTPRRRTNADGEILQNQKDDDSPTAKVLRKLPGRIVTIVEDRLPVKRKRKSSRSQNSDSLLSSVSPAVCSANSTSDTENTMKESPAARDHHTKRMWQSTKELAEGYVLQHSEDLPDHQTTIPPETKMTQKSSLPANQFPTTIKPDTVSGTPVQTDSSHSMPMIPVSSTNTSSGLALSIDSQVEILSPCLKRKRGRPRKMKPEDSPDCQSPIPMSTDNELPETVLPPSKCLEQASEGNKAEQSIFPICNLQGTNFPNSTSPIQSPAQETSPLSDTSASTGAVKNHNKAKPCEIESSASPKENRKSVDTKTEKSQDEEVQLRKKGSPKKGSPDKTSVESEDQSDNSLPLDKPKRGRPPRVRETNADLTPLSSCFSLVVTNENITCPVPLSDTAPQSNIFTYSSSTPMGVTDVSFIHSADSSSTAAHASSTDAKVSTDGSCTPGRDSTDASFTPARISATNASARVSTDDSPITPKIKADACPTPSKRKRGRPPKMQSPTPEERCSLPSASEQESSLDEAKNLKPPAKRATRKKRRVRAEENVTSQSQLSDSETSSSSSSESPPLTRLARVKMESSGHRDVKEIKSGGDSSSQTAPSIQSPATQIDSDCERLQLSSSRPDANLQSKTAECTVYPRLKKEVPLLKKLDNSSSQDSSASEIKSPRSEGIPRGRCTRNTPSESLVPALESEKDILRKVRRQSCIETFVRQSKMRTDSEIESTSEEDSTRPSKRLRGESERTRKSQGQSTATESVADRILRSVAAAAAAAAMSPASNTRSSAVTSPPPSTQSPSLVRKFGSQNITTLGNRGRKPKT